MLSLARHIPWISRDGLHHFHPLALLAVCAIVHCLNQSHPGQRGDAIVLTNLIPFRKIKLFVITYIITHHGLGGFSGLISGLIAAAIGALSMLMSEPTAKKLCKEDMYNMFVLSIATFTFTFTFVKFCQSKTCQAMHQVFPYDLGNVFLLNLTLFLQIPQHKYSVVLFTKFVGLFTCSLLFTFFYLPIGQHVFHLKENLYFVHVNFNLSLYLCLFVGDVHMLSNL